MPASSGRREVSTAHSEIVVGFDDSMGAAAALRYAIALADRMGADLVLVFCTEPPSASAGGAGDQRDVIASIAEEVLGRANELAQSAGVASRGEVVAGRPVEGLIAVADQVDAPMIVVGHH